MMASGSSAKRAKRGSSRALGAAAVVGGLVGLLAALIVIATSAPAPTPEPFPRVTQAADATWPAGARPAPDFRLRTSDGKIVSLSSLRGDVVLLTFLDSRCDEVCPIAGAQLASLMHSVAPPERPTLLVVSVNPDDSPTSIASATRRWGWPTAGWRWKWLLGSPDELHKVWAAYGVDAKVLSGEIAHTGALYVIDAAGDERAGYAVPFDVDRIRSVVTALAAPADGS
jgi:protein SCO1/2